MGTPQRLDGRKGNEMGCVNTMLLISRCIEGVRGRLLGRDMEAASEEEEDCTRKRRFRSPHAALMHHVATCRISISKSTLSSAETSIELELHELQE